MTLEDLLLWMARHDATLRVESHDPTHSICVTIQSINDGQKYAGNMFFSRAEIPVPTIGGPEPMAKGIEWMVRGIERKHPELLATKETE